MVLGNAPGTCKKTYKLAQLDPTQSKPQIIKSLYMPIKAPDLLWIIYATRVDSVERL